MLSLNYWMTVVEQNKLKSRTVSRVKALQALYALEFNSTNWKQDLEYVLELSKEPFSVHLIEHFLIHQEKIDKLLSEKLESWTLNRLNYIDRNILRLGFTELILHETDRAVIINEYVEIAKIYGTEKSASFVNGMIDSF